MLSTFNDPKQSSLLDFYSEVADQFNTKVFLWGALVQALVLELNDGHLALLKDLAGKTTDNRLLRSALVEALVRFGEGDRKRAEAFILELVGNLNPPKNFLVELIRLLRPAREYTSEAQPQKMIVVEAAMRLRLTDLLQDLAVEPSPWLRNLAAQNIFYLWKQDHQAGMQVLDSLSYRVRGKHGLLDLRAAESMLALIGAILGVEHKDPATLESLSTIGRRALRRLLYLTDLDKLPTVSNGIRQALLGIIYNLVTGVVLKFALKTVGDWGKHAWASRAGMEHFFKLSPEQKALVKSMIPYLDYDEPGYEERIADIIKVEDWGDQLSEAIVEFPIMGRGVRDFDQMLVVVQKLTQYGLSHHPPRFWTGGPMVNLWHSAARIDNPNPDFMSLYNKLLLSIQEDSVKWSEHAQRDRPIPLSNESRTTPIGPYLAVYYIYTKQLEIPDLIQKYVELAIKNNDDEYVEDYIREFASIFEVGYPHIAIAALKPAAYHQNRNTRKAIIDFLVRARNYDPEYVEDLLLRGEFPREIADQVLANPSSERLTDLLSYQLITIVYDLFILGPKTLRNELKWLFSKALELPSFEDFVTLIIREIFNLVLGEVVFSVPQDAPSRQKLKGAKMQ